MLLLWQDVRITFAVSQPYSVVLVWPHVALVLGQLSLCSLLEFVLSRHRLPEYSAWKPIPPSEPSSMGYCPLPKRVRYFLATLRTCPNSCHCRIFELDAPSSHAAISATHRNQRLRRPILSERRHGTASSPCRTMSAWFGLPIITAQRVASNAAEEREWRQTKGLLSQCRDRLPNFSPQALMRLNQLYPLEGHVVLG